MLIDFWTYTCINCIRTLPYLKAWDEEYRDDGLTIVGVHTPEFAFEKDAGNVADAIADNEIRYPVVQDNELGTWSAFGNQYWPAKYLIGADGQVRFVHFGEGAYEETEQAIRSLLAEAGDAELGAEARARTERIDPGLRTPETYLGFARAEGWVEPPRPGDGRLRVGAGRRAGPERVRLLRPLARRTRSRGRRSPTRRSASRSRRGACSWCWAPRTARRTSRSSSTASRSRPTCAGEDVTGGVVRSPASASTASSTSPRPAATR